MLTWKIEHLYPKYVQRLKGLRMTFSEEVEADFTKVTITDDGKPVQRASEQPPAIRNC